MYLPCRTLERTATSPAICSLSQSPRCHKYKLHAIETIITRASTQSTIDQPARNPPKKSSRTCREIQSHAPLFHSARPPHHLSPSRSNISEAYTNCRIFPPRRLRAKRTDWANTSWSTEKPRARPSGAGRLRTRLRGSVRLQQPSWQRSAGKDTHSRLS